MQNKTNIEQRSPPEGETSFSIQMSECPDCRADMFIYVGLYISWEECLSCRYSRLIGWSSCQSPALQLSSKLA